MTTFNRRQFLIGGAALGWAAFTLDGCGSSDSSTGVSPDTVPTTVATLPQPPEIRSVNGILNATLNHQMASPPLGSTNILTRTYNGALVGPTLRIQPGDTMQVMLNNNFPPNPDPVEPANINMPHQFNSVNLHTHGIFASPSGISDNVLRTIDPGTQALAEIAIPTVHPTGTFWYHPHKHGAASVQMFGGMAGALIIEGDLDAVPEVAAAKEVIMVFGEIRVDSNGAAPTSLDFNYLASLDTTFVINGVANPTITMRPGEVQRWRIIQGLCTNFLQLTLAGHTFQIIAKDGITWEQPQTVSVLNISPGERYDVMVQAGSAGSYVLNKGDDGNFFALVAVSGPLATVVVEGAPVTMSLAQGPLPTPALLTPIADSEIVNKRTVTFNVTNVSGVISFLIDNQQFDPTRVDQTLPIGTAEEWTLVNMDAGGHPFHIHVNPFMVTAINGTPLSPPVWQDTIMIPASTTDSSGNVTPGTVTMRTRFLTYTGQAVLHCHIFTHEDMGMMQLIEFV